LDALYYIVIFIFVLVCLMLIGIILMQSSQSGGMGSALGGNALNAAFGGQGADKLLVKITAFLATAFMLLAIALNIMSAPGSNNMPTSSSDSILDRNKLESLDNSFNVPVGKETETKKDSI